MQQSGLGGRGGIAGQHPESLDKARSSPVLRIVRYNGVGGFASQLLKRGGEGFMHENTYTHSPWPQTGEEKRGRGEGEERAGVRVRWVQSSGVRNCGEGAEHIGGD